MSDHEHAAARYESLEARAITTFQLLADNGGYNLVLGVRKIVITDDQDRPSPEYKTEVVSIGFLSHAMMKDLARVMGLAVSEFEEQYGRIPLPGLDERRSLLKGSGDGPTA